MPWPATSVADTVAALKVEPVIVIDESNTCGLAQASPGATTHDWLTATGGAIGYAIPAVGAAITAPDCAMLCPHADRPAMDTTSRLWTRRGDTSTSPPVTDNNGAHDIVRIERQRLGRVHPRPQRVRSP